jgi:hypothetical protein
VKGLAIVLALCLAPAGPAGAQTPLESLPGFFPAEYLDLVDPETATIEINLQGAMLRMISAFTGEEDPEFARLVEALDGIRVRSGSVSAQDLPRLRRRIEAGRSWLEDHGWLTLVRVQDAEEEVFVYTREAEGMLVGLTVLAIEGGEVTAVNLVGRVDPALLVHLAEGLDLDSLDAVHGRLVPPDGEQP